MFGNHWLKLHIKCHNFPLFLHPKLIMTFQFHYFRSMIRISPIKATYGALKGPIILLHLWAKRRGNERTMRLKLFKSEENSFISSCIVLTSLWLTPQWSCSEVAQSCPTLCNAMDCSLPGFSIHGVFQARVLEWVAISFSRGPSRPRDQTQVSCTAGRRFTVWATGEASQSRMLVKTLSFVSQHKTIYQHEVPSGSAESSFLPRNTRPWAGVCSAALCLASP